MLDYKKTHYNSGEARRYVAEKTAHLSEPVKKDYTSLLMGKTIPEIPSVFRLIPSDALVLYIPQPKQFFDFLKDKQYSLLDLMGLNMYGTVQFYMKKFLSIEDGARFESLLQHEVAVVLPRMDMVAPTVVLLVRDADQRILEVMDQGLVKRDIEDWTIIAPSEQILDAFISPQQTLADAPDFQYVWEKKSHRIQDAFIFAGDQFFENITHLEYFISMQRRYKLYEQLVQLQQLVWAYEDAFGSAPSSLSVFQDIGLETLAHEALAGFSLEGNRVRHTTLGFIDHIYPSGLVDSLEMITRDELDAYLNSIFSYREVWTESLDPMGIVLNTYQDGVEVEFFMTPVPDLENTSFSWIQTLFKHTTKKRLDVL